MPFGGFDTESMVGKGATLNIIHKTSRRAESMQISRQLCRSWRGMEAQVPDRVKVRHPYWRRSTSSYSTGSRGQQVAQPAQKLQPATDSTSPRSSPLQTATTVTVDQPQPVPVQQPVQQPIPVQPQQATMGTQFTGPAPENVPF